VAGIPLIRAARGLKPVLLILAFTFLFTSFTFSASSLDTVTYDAFSFFSLEFAVPQTIAFIGGFGIVPLGILRGLYFALRITLLVSVTTLLTFTTSIVSLTDAIASFLSPLRLIRVPVEDLAMMFTIGLRFIPLTAAEVEKIMVAQTARGVRFDRGGLIKRARAYIPVMVPLFVNLFRRADELAAAMESRCYEGAGRTRLKVARLTAGDLIVGLCGSATFIALGVASLL